MHTLLTERCEGAENAEPENVTFDWSANMDGHNTLGEICL